MVVLGYVVHCKTMRSPNRIDLLNQLQDEALRDADTISAIGRKYGRGEITRKEFRAQLASLRKKMRLEEKRLKAEEEKFLREIRGRFNRAQLT